MMPSSVIVTVSKDGVTAEQVAAVIQKLQEVVEVDQSQDGLILLGPNHQEWGRPCITYFGQNLSFSVRENFREPGLWIGAFLAKILGCSMINAEMVDLQPSERVIRQLLVTPPSAEGLNVAERLGVVLPRLRAGTRTVSF